MALVIVMIMSIKMINVYLQQFYLAQKIQEFLIVQLNVHHAHLLLPLNALLNAQIFFSILHVYHAKVNMA